MNYRTIACARLAGDCRSVSLRHGSFVLQLASRLEGGGPTGMRALKATPQIPRILGGTSLHSPAPRRGRRQPLFRAV